ncbi:GDP-mannose 4,6 dehydratase [Liparis tanakae]|uniref:GDP-mannose 4,6-dehydratase n=1 Tax=Liparis tanakae TaxID=230148 RepID=A0A4Z2IG22_9TELE|nr:GDP-mannose 4,6 dehydratase [Liparis tanakae]
MPPHPRSGAFLPASAMWLMLQEEVPEDFVIATGEVHSVREFVEKAFAHVGKTIVWEGKDEQEIGRCQQTGVVHIKVDPKYFRPTEVELKAPTLAANNSPLTHHAYASVNRLSAILCQEKIVEKTQSDTFYSPTGVFCSGRHEALGLLKKRSGRWVSFDSLLAVQTV